jgi:hypothetical protein
MDIYILRYIFLLKYNYKIYIYLNKFKFIYTNNLKNIYILGLLYYF